MTDTAPTQEEAPNDPTVDETSTPDPEQQTPESDEFKSEESKNAVLADLKSEREKRQELQEQVDQFKQAEAEAEKAKLSDIERAQAEVQEARADAEKANAELLKYKIAGHHKITDEEDIELFLTGSDEETLTRQAERLAARSSGPKNPQPDHSAGPKQGQVLTDAEKVAAAEKSGDKQAASLLKAQQLGKLAETSNP